MTDTQMKWIPKTNWWFLVTPLILGSFLFMLNETIANVALHYMAGGFSISHEESIWILTSYLVSSSILISTVDFFSKLIGRKNFLLACLLLFTIASFLCGISQSLGMIVIARILQGIGGGPILPITQAIILELFEEEEERAVPIAIFGLVVVLAPILGPVIGGWLTLNYSWSWIFYINIPLGLIAVLLGFKFLEDPEYASKKSNVTVDALGFVFLALFIGTLQIILDKSQMLLKNNNMPQSISAPATPRDNAPIESFFGHLKDKLDYKKCKTFEELSVLVDDYIYNYNCTRKQ